jgi:hypothetical protein
MHRTRSQYDRNTQQQPAPQRNDIARYAHRRSELIALKNAILDCRLQGANRAYTENKYEKSPDAFDPSDLRSKFS